MPAAARAKHPCLFLFEPGLGPSALKRRATARPLKFMSTHSLLVCLLFGSGCVTTIQPTTNVPQKNGDLVTSNNLQAVEDLEITKVENVNALYEAQDTDHALPAAGPTRVRAFALQGPFGRQFLTFNGRPVYPETGTTTVMSGLSVSPENGVAFFEVTSPAEGLQLVVLLPTAPTEALVWPVPLPYSPQLQVFWVNEDRITVGRSLWEPSFSIRLSTAVSVR